MCTYATVNALRTDATLTALCTDATVTALCSHPTVTAPLDGSAKGPGGNWFHVTDGVVYFDHPVHAMAEHTLNIDFSAPGDGPSARVAVELTATSARTLVEAIQAALDSAPEALKSAG